MEGETVQLRIVLSNTSSSVVTVMLNSLNMTINGKDKIQAPTVREFFHSGIPFRIPFRIPY